VKRKLCKYTIVNQKKPVFPYAFFEYMEAKAANSFSKVPANESFYFGF